MQTAVYGKDKQLSSWTEGVLGPQKENNGLKGSAKSSNFKENKVNFRSTLMLRAGCIHLGLITLCPGTSHPLFNYKCHLN